MATEYRVVWKRSGMTRKSKRFASLKAAQKRAALMGPEPWTALGVLPDDSAVCGCPRDECQHEGETWRERLLAARNQGRYPEDSGMPAIEYIRIEQRPTVNWEPL
jgi:hypothetical protein